MLTHILKKIDMNTVSKNGTKYYEFSNTMIILAKNIQ